MSDRRWWVSAAQFTGLGWWVAAAILLPTLGGAWLDGRLGASPLFLLTGLLLGLAAAFYGAHRMAAEFLAGGRKTGKDADEDIRRREETGKDAVEDIRRREKTGEDGENERERLSGK